MSETPDGTSGIEDDGGPVIVVREDAGSQSLHVRVGPVFDGGSQRREPGIWIEYQEEHGQSPLAGPVLLTPATWRELARAVDRRLQRRGRFGWPKGRK